MTLPRRLIHNEYDLQELAEQLDRPIELIEAWSKVRLPILTVIASSTPVGFCGWRTRSLFAPVSG